MGLSRSAPNRCTLLSVNRTFISCREKLLQTYVKIRLGIWLAATFDKI